MMKVIYACLVLSCLTVFACRNSDQSAAGNEYDSALARKLKADSYGMKQYVMCFLEKGKNRNQPKEEAMKIQRGHLANIDRLAMENKILIAGPFLDTGNLRGIFILNTADTTEALKWISEDPAIKSGRLAARMQRWYGSAALQLLKDWYGKVTPKTP